MAWLINSFVMSPKVNRLDIHIHLYIRGGFCLYQRAFGSVRVMGVLEIVMVSNDVTVFVSYITRGSELWNDERYLSDIKIPLGSVLHLKVHCYTQFSIQRHRIRCSIVSSLLQHRYHTFLLKSLK